MPWQNTKKPARAGRKVKVGKLGDVPEGCGATVQLKDGTELALYRVGGEFYAIENFCPHKGAPLADGNLCGHAVACDWHDWKFDVRTGQCLSNRTRIETYEVVIENGDILIIV